PAPRPAVRVAQRCCRDVAGGAGGADRVAPDRTRIGAVVSARLAGAVASPRRIAERLAEVSRLAGDVRRIAPVAAEAANRAGTARAAGAQPRIGAVRARGGRAPAHPAAGVHRLLAPRRI